MVVHDYVTHRQLHGHRSSVSRKRTHISSHSATRRVRARFHSSHMEVSASKSNGAHKHEAQMIPGVDGVRIWGFPNSIITKLRYVTFLELTAAASIVQQNVFAANGIFDPDITGVGHQPLYRDNYAALYDQYVVLGSKIKCSFASNSTTVGAFCGIVGDDDSTTSSNIETLMEQNNGISDLCPAAGGPVLHLSQTFEPLKDFGVDAKDDGASATAVGANPTELWCYKVFALPSDNVSVTTTFVRVEIEYTVKFTELQTPTQN